MRTIKYELSPEAYMANGKFIAKDGTVGDLVIDTGMLTGSDYDKVIPPLNEINVLFKKGCYPRCGEWEPFELNKIEYEELVDFLCSLPLARPYRASDRS